MATTPLLAQFTAPEINLPETEMLLPALKNSDKLQPLMEFWLEAYRAQLGGSAFSVEGFMTTAQARIADLHPDADFELGADAYENIKSWVFEALAGEKLTQAFDDTGNLIQLKTAQA